MRFLIGLGNDGALGHRPRASLVGEALLGPHFREAVDELVPGLFGFVRARAEAAEFGPCRGAAGADVETAAAENVEDGSALGDFNWMIELGDAYHDAVTDAHLFGFHRACGEKQFRRGAMRIFLEEMMLDGPHGIEAE